MGKSMIDADGETMNFVTQVVDGAISFIQEKYNIEESAALILIGGAIGNVLAQNVNLMGIDKKVIDEYLQDLVKGMVRYYEIETGEMTT